MTVHQTYRPSDLKYCDKRFYIVQHVCCSNPYLDDIGDVHYSRVFSFMNSYEIIYFFLERLLTMCQLPSGTYEEQALRIKIIMVKKSTNQSRFLQAKTMSFLYAIYLFNNLIGTTINI